MLKINQILKTFEVKRGTNKQGKPYEIYAWTANAEVDGQVLQNIFIKSFKAIDVNTEKEFQYKKDEFHDMNTGNTVISYMLTPAQQQKKSWQSSRPTYTLAEYDNLWSHALKKFANITENKQEYISTYIITACQAGVKVSTEKIEKQIDQDLKKLDNIMNDNDIQF
jgi:hypothetical protein